MFIEVLFIITPNWKQPKCPLMGEWINTLWYIRIKLYFSTILLGMTGGCDYKESAQETFWGDRTSLYSDCGVGDVNLCMC